MNNKVKHIKTDRIGEIIKENPKTYSVKTLKKGYDYIYETILWKKQDVESYVEPVKEKSAYDKMREQNMEDAKKLPKSPEEIGQHILWLKMAVIDRIEKIENRIDNEICTFRSGKINDENSKFGFTEHYVNLLMHYAYEAGHKRATDNLTTNFNNSTASMKAALDKIKDALDDADWIDYPDNF
jgi:hypothetical protein